MFKLYYSDGQGGYIYSNQFDSLILAQAQAVTDDQPNYMIEQYDGNNQIIMCVSC